VKDEGGPLGIGFQERVSNHSKLLWSNGRGGERWSKSSGHDPEQVCVRKTNESKPIDDASLRNLASPKPEACIPSGTSLSGA
jgi:hypothetical protein